MNKFDRYIIFRLVTITLFVLLALVFIFIIIDFSENSDNFTDRGATMQEIWFKYYLNYVPEMIRLVTPVAVFIACLLLTGQMSDRLEIVALKAAGVSLYRLLVPFLLFAIVVSGSISYMDGYVVPKSNVERFEFERQYINKRSDRIDRNRIFRQESPDRLLRVNYYDSREEVAYRVVLYTFEEDKLVKTIDASRMEYNAEAQLWEFVNVNIRRFTEVGYDRESMTNLEIELSLLPRDIGRSTSDVYQLTYPEIRDYLASIKRSGAGGINTPRVQYYGKLFYPFSIIVVTLIGVSIASVRRRGGKGVHVAIGLGISFVYLFTMKLSEPFGYSGTIDPVIATLFPHLLFLGGGIFLMIQTRK